MAWLDTNDTIRDTIILRILGNKVTPLAVQCVCKHENATRNLRADAFRTWGHTEWVGLGIAGPMQKISLAIVDDEPLFREGAGWALSEYPDVDVIARAGSVRELIAAPGGAVPQVILLGVPVPGGVGAALQALCAAYPHGRVLMLSASECRADVAEAFRMGAHGYLHRNARGDELVQAVRSTFQQERYLSPALGAKLLLQDDAAKPAAATPGKVVGLSTREAEILCMLKQGLNNKLIAARLGLSDKTVKHYMTLLFQKLGVRSRLEAVLVLPPSAGYDPALQRPAADLPRPVRPS